MAIKLELEHSSESFKEWVKFRRNEIRNLLEPYQNLLNEDSELARIQETFISESVPASHPKIFKPAGYGGTWLDKIVFILKENDIALSSKDIFKRVLEIEPELKSETGKVYNSVNATLSVNSKDDKLLESIKEPPNKDNLYRMRKAATEAA